MLRTCLPTSRPGFKMPQYRQILETSTCFQKKEPEAFSLRLECAMVVFFMGRIVPVSGPVTQQDFGDR